MKSRAAFLAFALSLGAAWSFAQTVGVYDSRAVALAFSHSPQGRSSMKNFRAEYDKAKKMKDRKKLKELELLAASRQHLMHQQVFSSASIPNIVPFIKADLEKIATQKKLTLIVSKWDLAFIGGEVPTADVTEDLVTLFSPNAQVRKWIDDLKTQAPMPLQDLAFDPEK